MSKRRCGTGRGDEARRYGGERAGVGIGTATIHGAPGAQTSTMQEAVPVARKTISGTILSRDSSRNAWGFVDKAEGLGLAQGTGETEKRRKGERGGTVCFIFALFFFFHLVTLGLRFLSLSHYTFASKSIAAGGGFSAGQKGLAGASTRHIFYVFFILLVCMRSALYTISMFPSTVSCCLLLFFDLLF